MINHFQSWPGFSRLAVSLGGNPVNGVLFERCGCAKGVEFALESTSISGGNEAWIRLACIAFRGRNLGTGLFE